MKTPPVILVLAAVLIGPFFALAQNPPAGFWREWMKHPEVSAAIITKGNLEKYLWILPTAENKTLVTTSGKSVPFASMVSLAPNGLKVAGDSGIEIIAIDALPLPLLEFMGWSRTVKARYEQLQGEKVVNGGARYAKPMAPPAIPERVHTVGEVINEYARKEYPTDYVMQEAVSRWALEAYSKLKKLQDGGAYGVPDAVLSRIIDESYDMWQGNYQMIYAHARDQVHAYQRLNR